MREEQVKWVILVAVLMPFKYLWFPECVRVEWKAELSDTRPLSCGFRKLRPFSPPCVKLPSGWSCCYLYFSVCTSHTITSRHAFLSILSLSFLSWDFFIKTFFYVFIHFLNIKLFDCKFDIADYGENVWWKDGRSVGLLV